MAAKLNRPRVGKPSLSRRGMTLLELILALSLTVMVMLSVTMAIDLYWRTFDVRRTNVEEAQLARSLLRHIGDDLRSAMQYTAADLAGLEAVTQNSGLAAGAANQAINAAMNSGAGGANGNGANGAGTGTGSDASGQNGANSGSQQNSQQNSQQGASGGGNSAGGGTSGNNNQQSGSNGQTSGQNPMGSGSTSGAGGNAAGATADAATTEEEAVTVGLYGSATELRFDVSRLPRVDQYDAALSAQSMEATSIPSDIKTVSYFLRTEMAAAASDSPLNASASTEASSSGRGRGLMRREIDRAVASWAEGSGDPQSSAVGSRVLADEVVGLTFQYFDGSGWLTDWDSDELEGLPLAVEITLTFSDAEVDEDQSPLAAADETSDGKPATERTYRLVVRIPTAPPAEVSAIEAEADAEAESAAGAASTAPTAGLATP